MKIAFVGKGGSGKSTLAWLMSKALERDSSFVLNMDCDYNCDLSHNLGIQDADSMPQFNHAEKDVYEWFGLDIDRKIFSMFETGDSAAGAPREFSLSPADKVTEKYMHRLSEKSGIIAAGYYHEDSLYGGRCTHAYMKASKFYIGCLRLAPGESMVIDSPAGTDMLTYGLQLGADALVAAVEPTMNSIKVFRHIKDIADRLGIPCFAIANKIEQGAPADGDSGLGLIRKEIGDDLILGEVFVDLGLSGALSVDRVSDANIRAIDRMAGTLRGKVSPGVHLDRFREWKKINDEMSARQSS